MRILILGINYFPEPTSVSPFTTGLAEHLASRGHSVQVITAFPYYPAWRVWKEYRGRVIHKEVRNGVRVCRVRHFVPKRASSLVQRLLHDFSFALAALLAGLTANTFDIIYCSSPPPAVALAGYVLSRVRRVPYTIKLTDLASEAAIATGIVANNRLIRIARSIEHFAYSRSTAIFCLCGGFIDALVRGGIPTSKLLLIPDWGETERIRPTTSDGSFRAAYDIRREQFVALHAGNMGKKQDLLNIVRAAELTRDNPHLVWLIVGQGEERHIIETEISNQRLTNVRLLPLQPADQLCEMYAAADVLLLNQKATVRDAVIPSKLLSYMSSGRPVIAAVHGESEAAHLVRKAECGLIVPPEHPEALVQGITSLRQDTALRQRMAEKGRSYVVTHFSRSYVLSLYDSYFESGLTSPEKVNAGSNPVTPPVFSANADEIHVSSPADSM
jgi:colanic acid biosynthesis glycosyl transferase WcaI